MTHPPITPAAFACAPYIKEIGRGKEGARGLSTEQARTLYAAILRGEVSDFELGAVLIALRVKGETTDELVGFLNAIEQEWPNHALDALAEERLHALEAQSRVSGKPVVVIPSYNGARRKPNFTPLLACLLAQAGYPVLVHGLQADPTGRVTSAEVFAQLRMPSGGQPIYLPLKAINPALDLLLQTRKVLGVRSCTHTLVKLIVPAVFSNTVLVTSYTHPEFWHLQRDVLCAIGQTALVLRAHEGEPVAGPYSTPRMDGVKAGKTWNIAERESIFQTQPDPQPDIDAVATARLIEQWMQQPHQMPASYMRQVQAIEAVVNASV
ncbi:DNA-binding protein YbiB [Limnobacter sp.]|uniref:DNA-binding protein YbiB n=1 Tax=Limnobacter sp. TaxID=2003368 RepID=UPI003514F430